MECGVYDNIKVEDEELGENNHTVDEPSLGVVIRAHDLSGFWSYSTKPSVSVTRVLGITQVKRV